MFCSFHDLFQHEEFITGGLQLQSNGGFWPGVVAANRISSGRLVGSLRYDAISALIYICAVSRAAAVLRRFPRVAA